MNGEKPLVSILMTAYNREKYIAMAIESVLVSTYSNLELIIVDDGSKDNTTEIAQHYADRDGRVRLYRNENNLGDYPNRNQAAKYAAGKYLKYVDADDYIYPHGLQVLVETMEQFPEAGWGLCSLDQYKKRPFPFQLSPREAYEYNYLGPGLFHKAPLSSIFKKETFEAAGGFAEIRMAGDFEMWHRLAQRFPVVLMAHGIVWYREHGEQEINSYDKYIKVYEQIKIKYLQDEKCPLDEITVEKIIASTKKALRKQVLKGLLTVNRQQVYNNIVRLNQHKNG